CTEIDAVNVIFQEECKNFKSSIEKRIEDLEKENRLLQSEALHEYNCSYFPDIMNGVAQIVHTAYDAYTEDQKPSKYRENVYSILSLMHIRDILQFSIDVQEYHCYERQDLWDAMYQTPGTFIIRKRSDNVADKLAISVIKSDILSENPEPKSTGSQQPQKNAVDKGKNIMDNRNASTEQFISNNYKEGEMVDDEKNTKEKQVSASQAESKNEGDQQSSPLLSPQSSVSGHSSSSSNFVNVPTSDEGGTDTSNGDHSQTPDSNNDTSSFEKIDEEPVVTTTDSEDSSSECREVSSIENLTNDEAPLLDKENSTLEGDSNLQQDTQLKTLVPSGGAGSVVTEGDQPAPAPEPTPAPTPTPESMPVPTPTPEPTLSSTSKKPEQVNNTTPQNTKSSNLHIIAASALAVAGVILGVAIAVHLEILAVGILVGACCLIAAAVMYHYEWPSSFIETNKVEKVVPNEKKEPVATSA
ncbi:MAG: hypothetical protein LBC06_04210, partial [Rickettsiales bacterium]|nr:hypothetical protein [Rickettsiales bacterium]